MQDTVFETPVIGPFFRFISKCCLRLMGWKVEGSLPDIPKYVIIAAFHTSNWDFIIGIFAAFVLRIKPYWIGKDKLFIRPFDLFFSWIGGIPINRSSSQNMVQRTIEVFREHESLIIALAPEGTRKKLKYWKTGFYHIARGACIPVVLAFIDYSRKACGIGPVLYPSGNLEEDMMKIQEFYKGIVARHPGLMTLPAVDPARLRVPV